jgi:hypothetical protein
MGLTFQNLSKMILDGHKRVVRIIVRKKTSTIMTSLLLLSTRGRHHLSNQGTKSYHIVIILKFNPA